MPYEHELWSLVTYLSTSSEDQPHRGRRQGSVFRGHLRHTVEDFQSLEFVVELGNPLPDVLHGSSRHR